MYHISMSKLIVDNLSYQYRYGISAINNVCFSAENEIVAIVGEKESGKSTLTGLIAGIIKGYSGNITLISDLPERDAIAYLPDRDCLFEKKSVFYNLAYPLKIRKIESDIIESRVNEIADKFGITGMMSERIDRLSALNRVKVAYARAFLRETELLLLDDYYSSLDYPERDTILDLVKGCLKSYEKTALFCTDSIADARKITEKILVLRYGFQLTYGNVFDREWCSDVYCARLLGDEIRGGRLEVRGADLYLITYESEIKLDRSRLKSNLFIGRNVFYSAVRDILFDADSDKIIYF